MERGLRRGRQESVRTERKDKLGTPEKREVSQIVFPNAGEAQAARDRITRRNVVRGPRQGARAQSVGRRPRPDRKVRDHRSRGRATPPSRCPSGEISQPMQGRLGVALVKVDKIEPGDGADTMTSVAAEHQDAKSPPSAHAPRSTNCSDKMEDERGGGANVVEAAQKLGLTAVDHRRRRPPGRAPDGQPVANIPQGPRRGVAGLQQRRRRRQRPDLVRRRLCLVRRARRHAPRATARSTRCAPRSRRAGARTRSPAGCAPRPPRWCRSSNRAATLADEAAAIGAKVETPPPISSATPRCPRRARRRRHRRLPHRQGRRRTKRRVPRRRQRDGSSTGSPMSTAPPVEMASEDGEEAEGHACSAGWPTSRSRNTSPGIESEIGTTINQAYRHVQRKTKRENQREKKSKKKKGLRAGDGRNRA